MRSVLKKSVVALLSLLLTVNTFTVNADATCQSKSIKCSSYGNLVVNVWRQTNPTTSGNTLQWDYQVSSQYKGKKKVKEIRTSWYCTADLRKSATLTLSVGRDSISASSSKSWQTKKTKTHYWSNTNGSKSSSYRSNVYVGPKKNYERDSICTYNTGYVRIKVSKYEYSFRYTSSV